MVSRQKSTPLDATARRFSFNATVQSVRGRTVSLLTSVALPDGAGRRKMFPSRVLLRRESAGSLIRFAIPKGSSIAAPQWTGY